jgi:hypothetical protein
MKSTGQPLYIRETPVIEPSAPAPLPQLPPPAAPNFEGRAERLLHQVRAKQHRQLWVQGALLGTGATVILLVAAALISASLALLGKIFAVLGLLAGPAIALTFGLLLARRRVGDDARTARLVARRAPELSLDVLAAVELSRALGERHDFSPELARAFLKQVDARAAKADLSALVDARGARRSLGVLIGALLCAAAVLGIWRDRAARGLGVLTAPREATQVQRLEPITGDVTLTYRYPSYTGLPPRTVEGTNGELTAPAGTEVKLETRADRDLDTAAVEVNGERIPLKRSGTRALEGTFLLDKPGQYHFVFLDGSKVVAQGPDLPIRIEADSPPEVRITAPADELEIDNDEQRVTLKYDATDDYGLSELSLVFRAPGKDEQRLKLAHDEGRSTKGQYRWDASALKLSPGQTVSYFLEALDNDAVAKPKKGVSRTQTLKLYSAADHRRQAVHKAEAIWEKLVTHLADRMESPDREAPKHELDVLRAGSALDERGHLLATETLELSTELGRERDAPTELVDALQNAGSGLRTAVAATSGARAMFVRLKGSGPDFSQRLASSAASEVNSTEKSVLYLESLLDRQRLKELKELSELLRADRREMSKLLEDFQRTKDESTQKQLLEQMDQLKADIAKLMERMAELSKGIRDEHLNREALQEMMDKRDLNSQLEEMEKLVREGKADEAMKKMQELAMQMDEMLQDLDQASDEADQQADPELAQKFDEFRQNLEETVQQQAQTAEQTRALRDKYKEQMKQRVAQKGEALKAELLKSAEELKKSYEALDADRYGSRFERPRTESLLELDHLQQALKSGDFDLAAESAQSLTPHASELAYQGLAQRQLDERFANPPEVTRESQQLAERLRKDADKAADIEEKLKSLFPNPQQMMSEEDKKQVQQLGQKQRQLEKRGEQLEQQMDEIAQRAPVFNPEARSQMSQAAQKMGSAAQGLEGKDARKALGEQQGALEGLRGLQRQMEQQGGGKGKKGGLPMPFSMGNRGGQGIKKEKVEIPDEDPNAAPQQLRKDVMDAMKQGAPDRYREQNKRYYEELVK